MKICIMCKNINMYEGFGGGDATPAEPPNISCNKQHFLLHNKFLHDWRQMIQHLPVVKLKCSVF